jgi:uridine phosphorylase
MTTSNEKSPAAQPTAADSGDQRRIAAFNSLKLPRYVLLPGDPDRVKVMADQWDEPEVVDLPRGYRAAVGSYRGARICAVSTGIGAPSLEGVFNDLAKVGVDTFIRVGTTGTLLAEIKTGSMIINDAAVRLDGTTNLFVRPEFPAAASHEVTFALADAAAASKVAYRVGTGATTGSFTVGQGRPGLNGYRSLEGERIFDEMKRVGIINFEMETAALLTFARIFGKRAGSICSVIANRVTGEWGDHGGIKDACLIAAEAVRRLTLWDQTRSAAGVPTYTAAVTAPL